MDRNRLSVLAVIGTAGRKNDAPRITRPLYDAMYAETVAAMRYWGVRSLVSGGAAVADHIAVRAFLEGEAASLQLYLPAPFEGRRYVERPGTPQDAGRTANWYHRNFSAVCRLDSLGELAEAIARGASVTVRTGFKTRNLDVAATATHMLALTFGADANPIDLAPGGTALHGSGSEAENRRKVYADFGPDHPGFRDPKQAGLKDGGTAHTWGECWKAVAKRHVNLNRLVRELTME